MNLTDAFAKAISIRDYSSVMSVFGDYISKPKSSSYVGSCLNTMGNYFAKAKFRLYQKKEDKKTGKIYLYEVYEHPFLQLWNEPNEFQTNWELKYFIGLYFGAFGNYYLLVLKGLASGKPRSLIMLDPARVSPIGSKTKYIDYYEYNIGTEKIKLMPDEIIHLRYPYKGSLIEGRPIVDELADVIDTDRLQQELTKKFYKEGGFLGLTFTTNASMTTQSFERALKQLKQKYEGSENAFKVALFEQGLQPIKSAYSIKDMDLTNQRKLTQEEVLMAFRIPKLLMGASAEGYTKASSEAAEYTYAQTMIDPLLGYVSEVLTKFVKNNYGTQYLIKHDSVAPKDVERNLNYYKQLSSLGALTINEIRIDEDFDPLPYELADVNIMNLGGAAIRLDTGEQLGAIPNNRINQDEKSFPEVEIKKTDDEEIYQLHFKQIDRRFKSEVFKFKQEIKAFFENQKRRILKKFESKSATVIEDFFNDGELQILMNMMENAYMRFIERGMKYAGLVNLNIGEIKEAMVKFVNNSKSINETTKNDLLKKIKDSKAEDIRNIIENSYKGFVDSRSELIATSSVESGFNLGLWTSYKAQGFKKKVWISMQDTEVRDSHFLAHGQERNIDDYFEVGGELLMYPGDPNASAEQTINCRCVILGKEN